MPAGGSSAKTWSADLDLAAVFRQRLHDPRRRKEQACQPEEAVDWIPLTPLAMEDRPLVVAPVQPRLEPAAEVLQALTVGTRDYVRKNGFREVVIALSGGIDSALVAAVAVESLGRENVVGVFMPTRYSSDHSREDATQLAENLGIRFLTVPIDEVFQASVSLPSYSPAKAGQRRGEYPGASGATSHGAVEQVWRRADHRRKRPSGYARCTAIWPAVVR